MICFTLSIIESSTTKNDMVALLHYNNTIITSMGLCIVVWIEKIENIVIMVHECIMMNSAIGLSMLSVHN